MWVKMALSNSTIKIENKPGLYYSKYLYRASIKQNKQSGIHYIKYALSYEDFIESAERHQHWQIDESKTNYLIKYIYELIDGLKKTKASVTFRYDYDRMSLFSNDESLIQALMDSGYDWEISQAQPNPAGVIYFVKKNPPGKYRTYLTSKAAHCAEELIQYLTKTPDIKCSKSLGRYLSFAKHAGSVTPSSRTFYNGWASADAHYVDYNDERNLMMMQLLFSGAIGKTYKLEKKLS
jgi:hypothetical protein